METENPYPVQRETVKNQKEGDEVTLFFEVYMDKSFKERVKSQLISSAKLYFEHLVCNDYLIYSKNFKYQKYYLVSAKKDNFLHLTGVRTDLKANEFFEKCFEAILTEDDFDLGSKQQKGLIRRKISVLDKAIMIFSTTNITVEEKFEKNRISCSFASADKSCTIGFTKTRLAKPQTVLKGNRLNTEVEIDVILSKTKDSQHFEKIIQNKIGYSLEELNLLFGL